MSPTQDQKAAQSELEPFHQPQALRAEVSNLLQIAADLRRHADPQWAGSVVEANEQLILASLHSDAMAETAAHELDQLTRLLQRDALTDTPNRALMLDRLEHAIAVAKRNQTHVAVLFVDLDDFKQVNDTLGHTVGDEVLKAAARRLESVVRASDTVSRHGGDEFLVLLSEISEAPAAALIAKKMLSALATPVRAGNDLLFISASIGIAVYPDDGEDASALIQCADTAMYHSKRRARGRYAFHNEDNPAIIPNAERTTPPGRRRDAIRLEHERRLMQEQERTLRDLREANANLVAAAIRTDEQQDRPVEPTTPQLTFQADVARELRSAFTPSERIVELLKKVHTHEPLLQVLIERELAHLSTRGYESFEKPRFTEVDLRRCEMTKSGEFDALGSDGTRYTVFEFTVTTRWGPMDQTWRALTEKSFGLANGDRVDRLSPLEYQVAETGLKLSKI